MTVAPDVGLERFGRYTLLRPIASGGMAEIHLASFEGAAGVQKLVAIKRILPEHAGDGEFVAMFMNEARIAASLHHANVVEAYDFGSEAGRYFLAMEYLRGLDIRRIVQALGRNGRPMPLEIAIAIGIGAAAGLHYLHEKRDAAGAPLGLVHRDISPPNMVLTSDGIVKLVDFGIAKAVRRAGETRTGTVKGKASYMSPEQCRCERLDRRSDIFALAIVLWELTVGRRLFQDESDLVVMNAITTMDAPRPSQMASGYPRELERIVSKGLTRDRNRRYQTAEEMQHDLEAFARTEKLAVTQGSVSSFVRSIAGGDHLTIAALDSDTELAPAPHLPAAHAGRTGPGGGTRVLSLRPVPSPVEGAIDGGPSGRRALLLGALVLLGAGAGLGTGWTARQQRPVPAVADTTAPPPPASAAPAAIIATPAKAQPARAPSLPPASESPVTREKHDRARRVRPRRPPVEGGAPPEKWSLDSALPPPP
jgi:serine/threonine protein kinase